MCQINLPPSELVLTAVAVEDADVTTAEDSPRATAALLSSSRLTWTPKDWTCPCKISFVVRKLSICSLPCNKEVERMGRIQGPTDKGEEG